ALELAHARALARRLADHRRLRVQLFQVLDDRQRLREMTAIVELEDGKPAERVLLQELRGAILLRDDVHLLAGNLESLLGEVHAQLLRVRRSDEIIDLHRGSSLAVSNSGPAGSRNPGQAVSAAICIRKPMSPSILSFPVMNASWPFMRPSCIAT